MKIDSLVLENFGIYGMKQFTLACEPLILIYGSNEAGKTTALNGLRQALFGFPVKTPYLTGKTMASNVRAVLRDGQRIEFSRRKKQVDAFSGKRNGQTPLAVTELNEILGDFDLRAYESLFGFSLDELRKGHEALKHSKLTDALAGGGLGGLDRLVSVQRQINDFLSDTLKRLGGNARINAKLAEIRDVHETLDSAVVSPAELDQLRTRMADAEGRRQSLTRQLEVLRSELSTCENLAGSIPMLAELRSIDRLLVANPIPTVINADFCQQWTGLNENRTKLVAQIAVEQKKLADVETRLSKAEEANKWLDFESEIEAAGFHAGEVAALRRSEISGQRDQARVAADLQRYMHELNLNVTSAGDSFSISLEAPSPETICLPKILKFNLPVSQRQELDSIVGRFTEKIKQDESLSLRLAAAQQLQGTLVDSCSIASTPNNLNELERCCVELESAFREYNRLEEAEASEELQRAQSATAKRLAQRLGCSELHENWEVPSSDEIVSFAGRFDEADRELAKIRREQERVESELARMTTELDQDRGRSATLPLDELRSVWLRRDACLASWRDELNMPLLAASITRDEQSVRLAELQELAIQNDELIGRLLEAADVVAAINEKKQSIKNLQIEQRRLTATLEKLQRRREDFSTSWRALWNANFQPLQPEQMLVWSQEFGAWQREQRRLSTALLAIARSRSAVEEKHVELKSLWPDEQAGDQSIESMCRQVYQWRSLANSQQQLAQQTDALQNEISQSQSMQVRCRAELAVCREQFAQWMASTPYPQHWTLERMPDLLDTVDRAGKSYTELLRISSLRQECTTQIQQYETQVRVLAQKLAIDLDASIPAEVHASEWLKSLRATRHEHSLRSQGKDVQANQRKLIQDLEANLQDCDAAIDRMTKQCETESRLQIDRWLDKAEQNHELLQRKRQLEIGLQAAAGDQPLEALKAILQHRDASELALRKSDLQRTIRDVEQQRATAEQEIGAIDNELRQRQSGDQALRLAHQLQQSRGELGEMSEQWIIHKLADQLLSRTIERFSREHEPELMRHLRRHLTKLTGGRYTRVEQVPGKNGGFLIRDIDGVATEPDKLSTGTREQLYLAIRLAFVDHYCAHHEPLPVIMDDCFVNFDDQRARYAVEALLNWDTDVQTILLSCHGRMLQILADLAPNATVISLDNDQITSAKSLADNQLLTI